MSTMQTLRIGTTEGRFRMVMPELIGAFSAAHPGVRIEGVIGDAGALREQLAQGALDIAFSGITPQAPDCIEKELLFEERLYLVISEALLRRHVPDAETAFREGADLKRLEAVPFCFSLPQLHCMQILAQHLRERGIRLDVIHTSPHFDLHQALARENYAACFGLSLYIPHLRRMNEGAPNPLHVFSILGLEETNPVYILTNRERPRTQAAADFAALLRQYCASHIPDA